MRTQKYNPNEKIGLVTSLSNDIGKQITMALIKDGYKVVGCASTWDILNSASHDIINNLNDKQLFFPVPCNLKNNVDIKHVFNYIRDTFGHLDLCVNNAICDSQLDTSEDLHENWKTMFDEAVTGSCLCIREAVRIMAPSHFVKSNRNKHIVNVCSSVLFQCPINCNNSFNYAMRTVIKSIFQAAKLELSAYPDIHVSIISASPVDKSTNDGYRGLLRLPKPPNLVHVDPNNKIKPEDIADAVIYVLKASPSVNIGEVVLEPIK